MSALATMFPETLEFSYIVSQIKIRSKIKVIAGSKLFARRNLTAKIFVCAIKEGGRFLSQINAH